MSHFPQRLSALGSPLKLVCFVAFLGAVVRSAWVSDDAFITLDAVNNLVTGYGFVHNPPERVQGFTHPLWALLLIPVHAIIREPYFSALALGLVVTAAAAWLLAYRLARKAALGIAALLLLTVSDAFVDFSTSGLENPLSCLLLGLFALALRSEAPPKRWTLRLFLLGSLLAVTRLDNLALVAPALGYALLRHRSWRNLGWAAVGLLPLVAWELFALFYYGFLLPNSYYAKLNTGLPWWRYLGQGVSYFIDSFSRDPITLLTILSCVGIALSLREEPSDDRARDRAAVRRTFAAGLLLHLIYVAWIGGDFMAGRFFNATFYGALVLLVTEIGPRLRTESLMVLGGVAVVAVLGMPAPTMQVPSRQCILHPSGIVNERVCYQDFTGLVYNLKIPHYRDHDYYQQGAKPRAEGARTFQTGGAGLAGYAAGPATHLIDMQGVTDPFLARIRYVAPRNWRVGHYIRYPSPDYVRTVETGTNLIENPCLHEYYDKLSLLTRGPLFSLKRLATIVRMNLGAYEHLLAPDCSPAAPGPSAAPVVSGR